MLYKIMRVITSIALRLVFRKVYMLNTDRIPRDKPLLLMSNHPSAFMEPILMACYLDFPLYFLVRGDLFKENLLGWFLRSTNQLPIFRFRDGFANMKKNDETMDYCLELLNDHQKILVFAEGSTKQVRRVRPFQKGAARLAFSTMEKYPEQEVYLQPVGVFYSGPNDMRKDAIINFGEPLSARSYMEQYAEESNKTLRAVTTEVHGRCKSLVPQVSGKDEELFSEIVKVTDFVPHRTFPIVDRQDESKAKKVYALAKGLNDMSDSDKEHLGEHLHSVNQSLGARKHKGLEKQSYSLSTVMFSIVGFLPWVVGKFFHAGPVCLAKRFADNKVKEVEFYTSVRLVMSLVYFLALYLILFFLLLLFIPKYAWLILLLPIVGVISMFYDDMRGDFQINRTLKNLKGSDEEKLEAAKKYFSQLTS